MQLLPIILSRRLTFVNNYNLSAYELEERTMSVSPSTHIRAEYKKHRLHIKVNICQRLGHDFQPTVTYILQI